MKEFVRTACFKYLCNIFHYLSEGKVEKGIFIGHDICKLKFYSNLEVRMSTIQKESWISFKEVVNKLVVNVEYPNCELMILNRKWKFKNIHFLMRLKDHLHNTCITNLTFFEKTYLMLVKSKGTDSNYVITVCHFKDNIKMYDISPKSI